MDYTGQEISRQVVSPFSCRQVLELFLGTPTAARQDPYRLHRLICALGLPEARSIPLNSQPAERWRRLAGRAWRALSARLRA